MYRYRAEGRKVIDGVTGMHTTFVDETTARVAATQLNGGVAQAESFTWTDEPVGVFTGPPVPAGGATQPAPASAGVYAPLGAKKPSRFAVWARGAWPYAAFLVGGMIVGGLAVSAGDRTPDAAPAPAETVTVEVPVAVESTCQAAAEALFGMLQKQTSEVVIPLSEGGADGIEGFLNNDIAAVEAATSKINGATTAQGELTAQLDAVAADYTACVSE